MLKLTIKEVSNCISEWFNIKGSVAFFGLLRNVTVRVKTYFSIDRNLSGLL